MSTHASFVRSQLQAAIQAVENNKNMYVQHPNVDFSRNRKLNFSSVISVLLALGEKSLKIELPACFRYSLQTATTSAFIQQRAKLKPEAMEAVFHAFSVEAKKRFRGYRLLAADGSDLKIFADRNDPDSYYPGTNGKRPYGLLHLNALYDLENHIYSDAIVQKSRNANEHAALVSMVDRSAIRSAILLADRGYESYNNMAHLQEKGWKYLIRVKNGKHGLISRLLLPDAEEFDCSFELNLTRKQSNDVKALCASDPNHFRFLPSNSSFDFLPAVSRKRDPFHCYTLRFRVVRFPISDNSFETVVTNLDPNDFPSSSLKALYARRWGIETSFRDLKHTLGLETFHTKKVECALLEVFARLTMYNFTEWISSFVVIQNAKRKYVYIIDFSFAAHICRIFFLGGISPPKVFAQISSHLSPVRPGRKFPRRSGASTFLCNLA